MEEIRLKETLINTIHGKYGKSNKSTTGRVDMKPQN
jgi:hypothetical protein